MLFEIKETLTYLKSFEVEDRYSLTTPLSNLTISSDGKKMAFSSYMDNGITLADISKPLIFILLGADWDSYSNRMKFDPSGEPMDILFRRVQ